MSTRRTMSNCSPLLMAGQVVRRPLRPGTRVQILGLLEARLTASDRVVLGGLVEGTWPPDSRTDAWLSRPMRQQLGLDLPERRTGLSAHDFAQLFGARDVVLTHAAKIAGAPTVPSRFIQRLAAVTGSALAGGARSWTDLSDLGTRARPAGNGQPGAATVAPAAPRGATRPSFGDRDRKLAARSVYYLCQAHFALEAAGRGRYPSPAPRNAAR